jgi:hypothetical protein
MRILPRFSLWLAPVAAPFFSHRLYVHSLGKSNDVNVRDQFRIGIEPSKKIDAIVSEGRLLLATMRNPENTPMLKTKDDYIAKDSDRENYVKRRSELENRLK